MPFRRHELFLGTVLILLTVASTGCTAIVDSASNGLGGGNENHGVANHGDTGGSERSNSAQKSGDIITVAPGTLPPTGEPQPGHARLNEEGYYDYTADDFILGDPCPPEITQVFESKGYRVHRPGNSNVMNMINSDFCLVDMEDSSIFTGISIDPNSSQKHLNEEHPVVFYDLNGITGYSAPTGNLDTGVCKAAIDTPDGSRGIYQSWGPHSSINSRNKACDMATQKFKSIKNEILK